MSILKELELSFSDHERHYAHYLVQLVKEHVMSQLTDDLVAVKTEVDALIAKLGSSSGDAAALATAQADLATATAQLTEAETAVAALKAELVTATGTISVA